MKITQNTPPAQMVRAANDAIKEIADLKNRVAALEKKVKEISSSKG